MSNSTTTRPPTTTGPTITVPPSTVTVTNPTTSVPTTSIPPTTTLSVSISPTSTVVVPPSTSSTTPAVVSITSVITGSTGPTVVTITSTQQPVTITPSNTQPLSSSSSSASPTFLAGSSSSGDGSGGLGTSGKIAIAVIIPIVVIALLVLFGIFLWRKRKQRKSLEEQRKDEMVEYGLNPNNDPHLVPVGAAVYTDAGSDSGDGYRGWGTTSSNARKPSTTLGSNGKAANMTYSDTTSQPGNYAYQSSPNGMASQHWSGDPLIGNNHEGIDSIGALGGAAVAGGAAAGLAARNNRNSGIQRGPSNASSTYSHNAPHSDASSDAPNRTGNYYNEEVPYNIYNDVAPAHGPYGDGTYGTAGSEQPVIRDVQARRNTKIERVPTFPQTQGGISQNF